MIEWNDEEDTKPESNKQVLVWVTGEDTIALAHRATWSDGTGDWIFAANIYDGLEADITHWAPYNSPED